MANAQLRTYTCPDCNGDGGRDFNDTDPHGYGPDPQCDEWSQCASCYGEGTVLMERHAASERGLERAAGDSDTDLLNIVARLRKAQRYDHRDAFRYGEVLQRVVSPVNLPDLRA